MATFQTLDATEARQVAMPPRRAVQERYRSFVQALMASEEGEAPAAGRLDLEPGDKPLTERARLRAAAKAEGVVLQIQRKGSTIVFWPATDEDLQRMLTRGLKGRSSQPESQPEPAPPMPERPRNPSRKRGRR